MLQSDLAEVIDDFLSDQRGDIADQLYELIAEGKTADEALAALDLAGWAALTGAVAQSLQGAAAIGSDETIASIGVVLSDGVPNVDSWAIGKDYSQTRGAEMVGMKWVDDELIPNPDAKWQITEGTREMLRGIVERAIDEGMTTDEFSAEIEGAHAFSKSRAQMIARTEIRKAQMAGQFGAAVAMGATHKQWTTARDDLVSPECSANEADGIIQIEQQFSSGDDAPPAHPNCRCVVNYLIGDNEE